MTLLIVIHLVSLPLALYNQGHNYWSQIQWYNDAQNIPEIKINAIKYLSSTGCLQILLNGLFCTTSYLF